MGGFCRMGESFFGRDCARQDPSHTIVADSDWRTHDQYVIAGTSFQWLNFLGTTIADTTRFFLHHVGSKELYACQTPNNCFQLLFVQNSETASGSMWPWTETWWKLFISKFPLGREKEFSILFLVVLLLCTSGASGAYSMKRLSNWVRFSSEVGVSKFLHNKFWSNERRVRMLTSVVK